MSRNIYAGIEIGGTKLQVVLGDNSAAILKRFRFTVDPAAGAEGIRNHIEETLKHVTDGSLAGIGVGFGGPVNRSTGKIWTSYHIEGWSGYPLKEWLESSFNVPTQIDNDANVAALGEALFGKGKNYHTVFYITLGSGVGSGLVVGKKIYHGRIPGETELGHIRLDKTGRTLQSSCSGWAVDEKIRTRVRDHPHSILATLTAGVQRNEAVHLAEALHRGDALAKMILDETADDLALGISHAIHLLHPDIVVLGGGLSLAGEPVRRALEQRLPHYLMDAFQPGPEIQLSTLKEDVVTLGALAISMNKNYDL